MNTKKQDVVTTIRLPVDLHSEIKGTASAAGHPMNAEILIRLQSSALDDIKRDIAEIKITLRKLLDRE